MWKKSINQLEKKNGMTISIDTEKAFDKTQHPFIIKKKKHQQSGYIENKHQYNKGHISIILNGEKRKAFPLKLGTRQGCPLSPTLITFIQYSIGSLRISGLLWWYSE